MKTFTGFEYLCIDIANQYGLDKELFETRIQWVKDNLDDLESFADKAETKPLYEKAVMAMRKAQAGKPTGHLVGFDATCSGIQIMSALTGCVSGSTATGLVDPNRRADAYTEVTQVMQTILGNKVNVTRKQAKDALMTSFYGSKAKPKEIFGEETPELNAFYEAAVKVAPGAWDLLQGLLQSWRPYALVHQWKLPDGFDARVKVMQKKEARVEVDELNHSTFTYEYYENEGSKTGLSNVANVVHSVDAYVLRCIQRRCNYDRAMVERAANLIEIELIKRDMGMETATLGVSQELQYYVKQYERSGMADVVILPYLEAESMGYLNVVHLKKLAEIIEYMLSYKPFEVVTVHDEFKCHANNMNYLRQQYINVFAEMAESNLLDDLLSQVYGRDIKFQKYSSNLPQLIRNSNYALC